MADKEVKVTETSKDKMQKQEAKEVKTAFVRGILGLSLLLVFGSIAFSTVVIWTGTDNSAYKWLIAPQAIFDLFIAFVAFSKILK